MKRISLTLALALTVLLMPVLVLADRSELETYYGQCIDQRVEQNRARAARLEHGTEHMRFVAATAVRQARYLEVHRELLVKQMVEEKVPRNTHRVNYYLAGCYREYLASQTPTGLQARE